MDERVSDGSSPLSAGPWPRWRRPTPLDVARSEQHTGRPGLCHDTGLSGTYSYDGFCWDTTDDNTSTYSEGGGWYPQGLTASHDATGDTADGHRLHAASWFYGDKASGKDQYARVTFAESTGDAVPGSGPVCLGSLSLDRSTTPHALVSGEYRSHSAGAGGRVVRWPLNDATTGSYSCIHRARPGAAPSVLTRAPSLTQNLSYSRASGRLWGHNEWTGHRVVFSIAPP
ncbi:hypothetical protein ABZ547_00545 [Streptomyces sparsogenes]|uniref:hypothetical protein n=1 Tax=Streptomyces sparsogenes TaxID=67365 RepID=UPI0033CE1887